ncbi:phosphatase PAP2 family protein [Paraburkholderia sediminicola]|nr:phosphatase PAP2 family protein [Paraburkholderia sediminicola]
MTDKRFQIASAKPHTVLLAATLFLLALDVVWCLMGHWTVGSRGLVIRVSVALGVLIPLIVARYRRDERLKTVIVCSSILLLFSLTAAVFSYLIVSTNAELVDTSLARWDRALGFDWPQVFLWLQQKPTLDCILAVAYASVIPQIIVVIVHLSLTNRRKTLAEFNGAFVVSFLIIEIVSAFFPAAGPFKYYAGVVHADASMLSHFEPLRSGALRTIDLFATQGLVSIPSFHAILAILLIYAMRETRIRMLFLLVNIVVLVSTPTRGGHHLVDLIAGAFTVLTVIGMWNGRIPGLVAKVVSGVQTAGVSDQPAPDFTGNPISSR